MLLQKNKTLQDAADRTGMDVKTARKYRWSRLLPSQCRPEHAWRTRPDAFEDVWEWVCKQLKLNPRVEAKTLFDALGRERPGRFQEGQLRTLQRHVKQWRALHGPHKEVFFAQKHEPGRLCQSDFTRMGKLDITIAGQPFDHLLYHFVLTFSNWETCRICFSESFETLSTGLQNALHELGGAPALHRTDSLSAAVSNTVSPREFTRRYQELLDHYGIKPQKTQPRRANENGDVEQSHRRLKNALDQALMLRASRDFPDRTAYEAFLRKLVKQLNAGRQTRLQEEIKELRTLPAGRLEDCRKTRVRVDSGSLIHVDSNAYSVCSRLIGEQVEVRQYTDRLEVWHGQCRVEVLERLRGRRKHRVDYRHIIDWLVRKPGAFASYRHREDLFPTSLLRMAYDNLRQHRPHAADKQYLRILHLAAKESQIAVEQAIRVLIGRREAVSIEGVEAIVQAGREVAPPARVHVDAVDVAAYDQLLGPQEAPS
ncbi:MAG: IS21 family transposase [Planctomycetes bacterium]|nr:IS21 family transposase [Planctomycetota bacterium]